MPQPRHPRRSRIPEPLSSPTTPVILAAAGFQSPFRPPPPPSSSPRRDSRAPFVPHHPRHPRRGGIPEPLSSPTTPVILAAAGIQSPFDRKGRSARGVLFGSVLLQTLCALGVENVPNSRHSRRRRPSRNWRGEGKIKGTPDGRKGGGV